MCTYEWLCLATVSGARRFQQSGEKCHKIHQHAEIALDFRGREGGRWCTATTVTVQPYLQQDKSLSGSNFNEGMIGQF